MVVGTPHCRGCLGGLTSVAGGTQQRADVRRAATSPQRRVRGQGAPAARRTGAEEPPPFSDSRNWSISSAWFARRPAKRVRAPLTSPPPRPRIALRSSPATSELRGRLLSRALVQRARHAASEASHSAPQLRRCSARRPRAHGDVCGAASAREAARGTALHVEGAEAAAPRDTRDARRRRGSVGRFAANAHRGRCRGAPPRRPARGGRRRGQPTCWRSPPCSSPRRPSR